MSRLPSVVSESSFKGDRSSQKLSIPAASKSASGAIVETDVGGSGLTVQTERKSNRDRGQDKDRDKESDRNWADGLDSHDLCCDCIVGIADPLRHDVAAAIETAQQAGITVRMVTGDNVVTACAVARQCGILTEGGLAIEGPDLRALSPAALDQLLPRLQVLVLVLCHAV